jgi:hypothetical protein
MRACALLCDGVVGRPCCSTLHIGSGDLMNFIITALSHVTQTNTGNILSVESQWCPTHDLGLTA